MRSLGARSWMTRSLDGLSYYLAAGALVFAGDLQTGEAALTAAIQEAQARGSVLGFATASHGRAMTILRRGRLLDAALDARHALAVERDGWRLGLGGARVVLAHTLIERGDLEGAERHLTAAEATTNEGDPFRGWLLSARGGWRSSMATPIALSNTSWHAGIWPSERAS